MAILSKTQIDRLGDRLRREPSSEDDLRLLDQYRRSFGTAYETVITTVRDRLHLEPTGRPAKSTSSIIEKLRRESIRLSQVQDIAGCRVIVADILAQDHTVAILRETFQEVRVMDRRTNPSYDYRAVHVIVETEGLSMEVQVRSSLQHLWAELSERLSDVVDSNIKYGGGDQKVRTHLARMSRQVANLEEFETELESLRNELDPDEIRRVEHVRQRMALMKASIAETLRNQISSVEELKGSIQMIFLIEYYRPEGRIVTFKTFDQSERSRAEQLRLEIELDLNRKKIDHEVVLLEAADENALRKTHRRYFEDISQIAKSLGDGS